MHNTFSPTRFISTGIFLFIAISFFCFLPKTALAFSGAGGGVEGNPFIITSCVQLQEMNGALSAWYQLGNDVDCQDDTHTGGALWNSGAGFMEIPDSTTYASFTGNFNGNHKVISNLFINRPSIDSIGVFGMSDGSIYDVGVENVDITGRQGVGGLVGFNFTGTILNSYSTGTVNSGFYNSLVSTI